MAKPEKGKLTLTRRNSANHQDGHYRKDEHPTTRRLELALHRDDAKGLGSKEDVEPPPVAQVWGLRVGFCVRNEAGGKVQGIR